MDTLLDDPKLEIDCVMGGIIVLSILFAEDPMVEFENCWEGEVGRKRFLSIPMLSRENIGPVEEGFSKGIRISIVAFCLLCVKLLLFLLDDNSTG